MSRCLAELCPNWPGEGCVRGVADCPESSQRCWTCGRYHGPDEACPRPRAADDFYDDADNDPHRLGPVFMATYECECESCDEGIMPGEDIRADGRGGWIHADTTCEMIARA